MRLSDRRDTMRWLIVSVVKYTKTEPIVTIVKTINERWYFELSIKKKLKRLVLGMIYKSGGCKEQTLYTAVQRNMKKAYDMSRKDT